MGGSSSKQQRRESRANRNNNSQQPTVIRNQQNGHQTQNSRQTAPPPGRSAPPPPPPQQQQYPPMPSHLQQRQSPQYQNSYQQAQYNQRPTVQQQSLQRQDSVEIKEGEKIEHLATVDRRSLQFEPETETLIFEITNTVPCTYEVHSAIRETVSKGAVFFSPNRPKNPPVPVKLDRPYEAEPCAAAIDFEGVSDQEKTFVKAYPKQIPVAIVLTYEMPDGTTQVEYTMVAILPKCEVFRQYVAAKGHVYEVEHLFGAEHESEPVVADVVGGGEGVIQDDEDDLCVICLTEPKNTAVIPCRHLCLCKDCAEELKKHSPKCPVCRGPISQLLSMGS